MTTELVKNISEIVKAKYFKKGQIGWREIIIIAISLIAGILIVMKIIRMLNVSRPK